MKNFLIGTLLLVSMASYAHEQKLTLMLDWFVNPNHAPIIVAQQKGFFADHGLNITIQEPADPTLPLKLAATGEVDLAVSYQPDLIMDVSKGMPLIQAGTLIASPLNTLMVLQKSKIRFLKDLKGKKIGISVAGNEEANIGTMLAGAGINYSDVTIINVGWSLATALATGKVDAIWGGFRNFETKQLTQQGYPVRCFYPEEHGVPSYDELVYVTNKHTHKLNAIKAFNQALEQATIYIENHPDQAWKDFISYAPGILDNKLNYLAWQATLPRFALRPGAIDLARDNQYALFLYRKKLITTLPKAQDYVITYH